MVGMIVRTDDTGQTGTIQSMEQGVPGLRGLKIVEPGVDQAMTISILKQPDIDVAKRSRDGQATPAKAGAQVDQTATFGCAPSQGVGQPLVTISLCPSARERRIGR